MIRWLRGSQICWPALVGRQPTCLQALQYVVVLLCVPDCVVESVNTMEVEPTVPPDLAWWERSGNGGAHLRAHRGK